MQLLSSLLASAVALSVFSLGGNAVSLHEKRQIVVPSQGTTVAPADGSTIAPGAAFPFTYRNSNHCESGYSLITVYLSTTPPTDADVTVDGHLADGSFDYHFGDFLIANFGLPPMQNPPPPPSTLTAPTVGIPAGQTSYFTVVETFRDCPGGVPLEFGVETTTVVYA